MSSLPKLSRAAFRRGSGFLATLTAKALSATVPDRARRFSFWYRNKTLKRPNWFGQIEWDALVQFPDGFRMKTPFQEVHGMEMRLRRSYEPELSDKLRGWLKGNDAVVDVGANMGYFTLLSSTLVGEGGMVVALEPQMLNAQRLVENLTLNDVHNVILLTMAASDENALGWISSPPYFNNGVSSLHPELLGLKTPKTPVLLRRLDEILSDAHLLDRICLVKIDTEGHDLEVVRSMSLLLQRQQRLAIACELSPEWYSVPTLVELLASYGFTGAYFDGEGWSPLTIDNMPLRQCNGWFERN